MGFFLYINTASHEYAWDDQLAIIKNEYTKQGIKGIDDIFSKRVFVPNRNTYRPIPQSIFALQVELFGLNPMPGHIFSAILCGLTAILVFHFLLLLFPTYSVWFAFLIAALYTVHPLHVEVVANIKSQDEMLMFIFGMMGAVSLLKVLDKFHWGYATLLLVSFTASYLCKLNGFLFLGVYILSALYVTSIKSNKEIINFLIVTFFLGMVGVTFFAQEPWAGAVTLAGAGALVLWNRASWKYVLPLCLFPALMVMRYHSSVQATINDWSPQYVNYQLSTFSKLNNSLLPERELIGADPEGMTINPDSIFKLEPTIPLGLSITDALTEESQSATIWYIMGQYIKLFVFPHPLLHSYGYNQIPPKSWSDWRVLLSFMIHVLAFLYMLYRLFTLVFWKEPPDPIAYGIAFFWGTIIVFSHLIRLAPDTMADRFMYTPSFGLAIVAIVLLGKAFKINWENKKLQAKDLKWVWVVMVPILLAFSIKSIDRNLDWKNNFTLTESIMPYCPNNAIAQSDYAHHLFLRSLTTNNSVEKKSLQDDAVSYMYKALEIYPEFFTIRNTLGRMHLVRNEAQAAMQQFMRVLETDPNDLMANYFAGFLWYGGQRYDDAIKHLEFTQSVNPRFSIDQYQYLCKSYYGKGEKEKAIESLHTGLEYFGEEYHIYSLLASLYHEEGQYDQVIKYGLEAERRGDTKFATYEILAKAYRATGDEKKAKFYESKANLN